LKALMSHDIKDKKLIDTIKKQNNIEKEGSYIRIVKDLVRRCV